jgi:hypothetical protein
MRLPFVELIAAPQVAKHIAKATMILRQGKLMLAPPALGRRAPLRA